MPLSSCLTSSLENDSTKGEVSEDTCGEGRDRDCSLISLEDVDTQHEAASVESEDVILKSEDEGGLPLEEQPDDEPSPDEPEDDEALLDRVGMTGDVSSWATLGPEELLDVDGGRLALDEALEEDFLLLVDGFLDLVGGRGDEVGDEQVEENMEC